MDTYIIKANVQFKFFNLIAMLCSKQGVPHTKNTTPFTQRIPYRSTSLNLLLHQRNQLQQPRKCGEGTRPVCRIRATCVAALAARRLLLASAMACFLSALRRVTASFSAIFCCARAFICSA